MRPPTMAFIRNQIFIGNAKILGLPEHGFFVRIKNAGKLVFTPNPEDSDLFELTELLKEDSPSPYPEVSWSGILWRQQEAIEVARSHAAYLADLDRYF